MSVFKGILQYSILLNIIAEHYLNCNYIIIIIIVHVSHH